MRRGRVGVQKIDCESNKTKATTNMRVVHSRQSNALSCACPAAPRFRVAPVTLSRGRARMQTRPGGRKARDGKQGVRAARQGTRAGLAEKWQVESNVEQRARRRGVGGGQRGWFVLVCTSL